MNKEELSFKEIQNDFDLFLRVYAIEEDFKQCQFSKDVLFEIGEDYEKKCYGSLEHNGEYQGEYYNIIQRYLGQFASFQHVHSYRFRIKKTGSMLAKIIRKSAEKHKGAETGDEITIDNYYRELSDLLGLRILYVFKEDFWPIHKQIMDRYKNQLVEDVNIKLKKGDDESLYRELINRYSNSKIVTGETYRSIHYTLNAETRDIEKSPKLEIQTRTVFEEGWSEINHKLLYKTGEKDVALQKASGILSGMVGECDAVGTLMNYMHKQKPETSSSLQSTVFPQNEADEVGAVIRKFLLSN